MALDLAKIIEKKGYKVPKEGIEAAFRTLGYLDEFSEDKKYKTRKPSKSVGGGIPKIPIISVSENGDLIEEAYLVGRVKVVKKRSKRGMRQKNSS